MPKMMQDLIEQYVEEIKKIYGSYVRQIILYGSCARGDFRPDSDVDIMILADISDLELKAYAQQLSYMTYDLIWIMTRILSLLQKVKHILTSGL